jgi:hypothetical protein
MVRQTHHERNQYITVRPEPVEGLNQSFLNIQQRTPCTQVIQDSQSVLYQYFWCGMATFFNDHLMRLDPDNFSADSKVE